nr:MAG TPA: hypothetical protein [Caudoviricetes sp.]
MQIGGSDVSKMAAKFMYNAAKKSDALRGDGTVKKDAKLERAAQSGNLDFIKSIKDKKEALRVRNYYMDRANELQRKIAKLGSAESVYKNQRLAKEYRNIRDAHVAIRDKMHEFSERPEKGDLSALHDLNRVTETYKRSYNRRLKNYLAWRGEKL